MRDEAIVVFTAKSVERILAEGGTSAWRLQRNNARCCSYAVCTRNKHAKWDQRPQWTEGPEEHQSAFLVGKVSDVVACVPSKENPKENPANRFLVQFSEYALVTIPEVWKGDRNPVKYSSLEELGIDPGKLKWKKMPNAQEVSETQPVQAIQKPLGALTMAEAKQGLALTFNVAPEAIEITIRG